MAQYSPLDELMHLTHAHKRVCPSRALQHIELLSDKDKYL